MSENLSTLKRLAVCFGCCKSTNENPATTNAEALDFICDNYKGGQTISNVTNITLRLGQNGKVKGGSWTDGAGKHEMTIE